MHNPLAIDLAHHLQQRYPQLSGTAHSDIATLIEDRMTELLTQAMDEAAEDLGVTMAAVDIDDDGELTIDQYQAQDRCDLSQCTGLMKQLHLYASDFDLARARVSIEDTVIKPRRGPARLTPTALLIRIPPRPAK